MVYRKMRCRKRARARTVHVFAPALGVQHVVQNFVQCAFFIVDGQQVPLPVGVRYAVQHKRKPVQLTD